MKHRWVAESIPFRYVQMDDWQWRNRYNQSMCAHKQSPLQPHFIWIPSSFLRYLQLQGITGIPIAM